MAFKKINEYNDQLYDGLFLLRDDGDYADVIFLYRSENDVLVADTHYIKSSDYSGYVHCCGNGCPACAKGIRVQVKLFIPLYNITAGQIQFWDRNARFQSQLYKDVLSRFSNPSQIVFRITRHGASGDMNTKYEIAAIGRNNEETKPEMSYENILASKHVTMPEYYSTVCREYSKPELNLLINTSVNNSQGDISDLSDYQITPRKPSSQQVEPAQDSVDLAKELPYGEINANFQDVDFPSDDDDDPVDF